MAPLIAADGAGSVVRRAMTGQLGARVTEDMLEHGYKELTLPPDPEARTPSKHALHIGHGAGYAIALPNLDGSFTVTLFLHSEAQLRHARQPRIRDCVLPQSLSDVAPLMRGLRAIPSTR
jgi:kynurenine 3-monooxygenase